MKAFKLLIFINILILTKIVSAETYTLEQAVKRLLEYYPSLQIAKLKTDQASWEIRNINNQLSWKLSGSAGVAHDVSAFGTPFDRFEASANLNRKLESGHSLGFSGRYQYSDDSFVINNSFPNPSQSLDFDINYRIPFGKGEGNESFYQSVKIAEAQKDIEKLNEKAILKSLTTNIINLFHEIDNLHNRVIYTEASINRATRLKQYIVRNKELGIYEEKDVLESDAQLLKVIAERENLQLAMVEQKNSLRKLLGLEPNQPFNIKLEKYNVAKNSVNDLLAKTEKHDPLLQIKIKSLDIADAGILSSLSENDDKKDLVFSLGARTLYGDSQAESVSEEDYAAQIKFEYEYDMGDDAYTSRIQKARRQKDIAIEEIRLTKDELKYQLTALLDKIEKQRALINRFVQHNEVSRKKLEEATSRYKKGRIDTTNLIQFENDFHLANLDLSSARTSLSQTEATLALLVGELLPKIGIEQVAK